MNTNKLLTATCILIFLVQSALAQDSYQFGLLPAVNFNYKFESKWALNFKVESRQCLEKGVFNTEKTSEYNYILTDYGLIAAKKVGLNAKLSGGYLLRYRNENVIHRLIQQYTIVQRLSGFRLAHRFVADQTFAPDADTEYRLRYRMATELPLNGASADEQEFYIKINNEYLNSWEGTEYDLELRLVPMIGYIVSENHKVEVGLNYRLSSFLKDTGKHSFWTSFNWYIEI